MEIIRDALLALFSAIGLWTLARMAYARLWGGPCSECLLVVKAAGDGQGLETFLTWRGTPRLVILDCGLTKCGRRLCELVMEKNSNVCIYNASDWETWTKEAMEWTKQKI